MAFLWKFLSQQGFKKDTLAAEKNGHNTLKMYFFG